MDVRVRCLAFYEQKVVMIHRISPRHPDGYYILPGGGVDEGELPENACIREMMEETCLEVIPRKMLGVQVHKDSNGEHTQLYFLVDVVGGALGRGNGPEYSTEFAALNDGTHDPVLVDPQDIPRLNKFFPRGIQEVFAPHLNNLTEVPFFALNSLE